MGYYTDYELKTDTLIDDLADDLKQCTGYTFQEISDVEFECNEVKWYSYKEDLLELSLKHPGVLFTLHGEGEGVGDSWYLYVRDGKSQTCRAEMVFPPFNPESLK